MIGIRSSRVLRLAACTVAVAGGLFPATADVLPYGLKVERVLALTGQAGHLAQSPTGELWLLERETGTIRVLQEGTEVAALTLDVRTSCDAGLFDVAFPPDHAATGRALVSWLDIAGTLRVDEIVWSSGDLVLRRQLLDLGTTPGCLSGGGLVIDASGRLYIGVGDLGDASAGQDDSTPAGKVLRLNLDGSIPADNPDPTSAVFAKGFRDPRDLDLSAGTARAGGTLYLIDRGQARAAQGEINAVAAAGNFGWAVVSGDSGGIFDDPLVSDPASVQPEGLAVLRDDGLGIENRGSLIYAATGADELRQAFLGGSEADSLVGTRVFFDPEGDRDGTPDAACPRDIRALTQAADGMLYAANAGGDGGIWRVYRDLPGPREVSAPGSPFPLTLDRQADGLKLAWDNLSELDAGRPSRNGGQRDTTYRIWEGTLPLDGGYDHVAVLDTDGIDAGPARRAATIPEPTDSRYYLVTAQGDNLEGSGGMATTGIPRNPEQSDYCAALGYGKFGGECIDDFRHPVTGDPIKLIDYNPFSPTYLQALSVRDFRGKVVHLDISADNCVFCNLQAPTFHAVDLQFRDRDFILLTVLTRSLLGPKPYVTPEDCATAIADWSERHGETSPVLCDVDLNGDDVADVAGQFWHPGSGPESCGGTPQNLFIDQGGVIFDFSCAFTPGPEVVEIIAAEVNPEWCE